MQLPSETASPPSRAARWAARGLDAAWTRHVLSRPVLEPAAFERIALRGAPAAALGPDTGWREPFERLVASLKSEAALNPLGMVMAHGQIVQALRARIRAVALWRRHPEILERPVEAPVVVLGPMRSGTTRLHRLLACDPRFAHTRLFESLIPVPFRAGRDGRVLRARLGLAALRAFNPTLGPIHPMAPRDPEEEFGLFSFSFGSPQFEAQWRVPGFVHWREAADAAPLYREFRALLQTIAWSRGDPPGRTWLLKAPQFMQDLPAMLDAFPDARLICIDRDTEAVVGSSASLVWNQMRIQSDLADREWIGEEWLRKTMLRRRIAGETRGLRRDVPQIEIHYDEMDRDWRRQLTRIYDFLAIDLEPALLARMTAYMERARGHLGHRYALHDFGLARDDVAGRAAALIASLPLAM